MDIPLARIVNLTTNLLAGGGGGGGGGVVDQPASNRLVTFTHVGSLEAAVLVGGE